MNVSEWVGLAGLVLGAGGVAINIGVTKARVAAAERQLASLEAARERMGAQLHEARAQVRILAAVVHERSGRRKTLIDLMSEGGAGEREAVPAAQATEGSGGGEEP